MILRILLLALWIVPRAAAVETLQVECASRDHLEIRYELTLESIDGAAPRSGPVSFPHVVPGRSIQQIETGTQTVRGSTASREIPTIRISIAPSELAKIHALEAFARRFAANEVGAAPRTISLTGAGRLRSWGEATDLDRLRLEGAKNREQLVQAVGAGDVGTWLRAQLCRRDAFPAEVSAAVARLLSKPSWNSRDITSDLEVLTTFEKPEPGITGYDSDGSIHSSSYFRILDISSETFVDPNGNAQTRFHLGR